MDKTDINNINSTKEMQTVGNVVKLAEVKSVDKPKKKPENVHAGHRQRLRNRFIENGLDSFEDHNALELFLFYAIPNRDVNDLALFRLSLMQIMRICVRLKESPNIQPRLLNFCLP